MKILVTGAKGFIGKNLCRTLSRMEGIEIQPCDLDTSAAELENYLATCEFVFHLAGVNRPKDPAEFRTGNTVFTEDLLEKLASRAVPVLLASSTQAALENDYGRSKKAAEDAVFAYGRATGAPVYVYRFANVFGKWCRPNYNSAVATWCYNIARDLPIMVRDPEATVTLVYIDDVITSVLSHLPIEQSNNSNNLSQQSNNRTIEQSNNSNLPSSPQSNNRTIEQSNNSNLPASQSNNRTIEQSNNSPILSVSPSYTKSLAEIVDLLKSFRAEPTTLMVPDQKDEFAKKLYSTYLSSLPEDQFSYPVVMHCDNRGSFTELLHTAERGQVSVNISKPGITKGQHWHHTKHEKFCVVSGRGLIQFRKVDAPDQPVIDYHVSGEKIEVVRIPPGYTHNIINEGDTDMVTVMWANEVFDPQYPDTYFEKV